MSRWGFWYWLEKTCYKVARYARDRKEEAFDRDLDRDIRRLERAHRK